MIKKLWKWIVITIIAIAIGGCSESIARDVFPGSKGMGLILGILGTIWAYVEYKDNN